MYFVLICYFWPKLFFHLQSSDHLVWRPFYFDLHRDNGKKDYQQGVENRRERVTHISDCARINSLSYNDKKIVALYKQNSRYFLPLVLVDIQKTVMWNLQLIIMQLFCTLCVLWTSRIHEPFCHYTLLSVRCVFTRHSVHFVGLSLPSPRFVDISNQLPNRLIFSCLVCVHPKLFFYDEKKSLNFRSV